MSEQQEGMESMVGKWTGAKGAQGAQGAQGERGEKGEEGMPAGQRRAIIYLFILPVLIAAIALGGLFHYAHELASQQRQIVRVEVSNNRERCTSIGEIVAIPIPVPLAGNPSREAWADYEHVERARGVQLGCKLPAPRYVNVKAGNGS